MKIYSIIFISTFCLVLFLMACKKEFDVPPLKTLESANKINIAQIKAKYTNLNYRFKGDSSLYCVVTADEVSGNLYKDIYVKDLTGALHVKLNASGGLYIGDSIRINLFNVILNAYNNLIQLDSVDAEKSIVKLASGLNPLPIDATINQIMANTSAINSNQSQLIKLENVEFLTSDMNIPFADATGKTSANRIIKSCDGSTLTVRTSGYASFANKNVPNGNGSIKGIVSQFGNTMQLVIRNLNDVNMIGKLCNEQNLNSGFTYLNKDFNDNNLTSNGWMSFTVTNNAVKWITSTYSTTATPFAKISGYLGGLNTNSESWLISPAIDLSNSSNPVLNFLSAAGKFAGPPLDILISSNYDNAIPKASNWSSITTMCVISPTTSSYVWTPSGEIALSNFKSKKVNIAFKYTSNTAGACTYELDNIVVKEK